VPKSSQVVQEVLDSISSIPKCEFIRLEKINQVFACNENSDVGAHWIIDMQTSMNEALDAVWLITSR